MYFRPDSYCYSCCSTTKICRAWSNCNCWTCVYIKKPLLLSSGRKFEVLEWAHAVQTSCDSCHRQKTSCKWMVQSGHERRRSSCITCKRGLYIDVVCIVTSTSITCYVKHYIHIRASSSFLLAQVFKDKLFVISSRFLYTYSRAVHLTSRPVTQVLYSACKNLT